MRASESHPLAGVRVLVTRSRDDAPELRTLLEARGAAVTDLPTLAIEPPDDLAALDAALQDLSGYDWIAFVSRNAVRAVFDRLAALGLSVPSHLLVAAVGPSTAAELERRGMHAECVPRDAGGAALAAAMVQAGAGRTRVLLPAGDRARPELRQGLEAAGACVDQIVVYRTVMPEGAETSPADALRRGEIDVVALASPSALQNLTAMLGDDAPALARVRLVCIGPTTDAAARELGFEPAAVARRHTLDGLVDAITELYGMENPHDSA